MVELIPLNENVPIAQTMSAIEKALHREIDHWGMHLNTTKRIVAFIDRFQNQDASIWEPSDVALAHVYQSFIITASRGLVLEICEQTNLRALSCNDDLKDYYMGILTGSLLDWKHCIYGIISKPRMDISKPLIHFAHQTLKVFERLDIAFVFGNYAKYICDNLTYIKRSD